MASPRRRRPAYDVRRLQHDAIDRGWSVAQWAEFAGLSYRTAYRVIAGETSNPTTIARLALVLGRRASDYAWTDTTNVDRYIASAKREH